MGKMATPDDCTQLAMRKKEIWIVHHLGLRRQWET